MPYFSKLAKNGWQTAKMHWTFWERLEQIKTKFIIMELKGNVNSINGRRGDDTQVFMTTWNGNYGQQCIVRIFVLEFMKCIKKRNHEKKFAQKPITPQL